jgi:SAM-dependent methyltransferase
MMVRPRTFVILVGAAAALGGAVVVVRYGGRAKGRTTPGGVLIRHAALYDALSHRLLLSSLVDRVAAAAAAAAAAPSDDARVLEVGCGPGRLSILLARRYGLDVTGVDLDPAMIERAKANASHPAEEHGREPSFLVGDVASLSFPDRSFDLVVSTLSMHHWADPTTGLAEIGRVLRPDGRALVWDFRAGPVPLHGRMPDPAERAHESPLRVVSVTPWRWPWRLRLTHRIELVSSGGRHAVRERV